MVIAGGHRGQRQAVNGEWLAANGIGTALNRSDAFGSNLFLRPRAEAGLVTEPVQPVRDGAVCGGHHIINSRRLVQR